MTTSRIPAVIDALVAALTAALPNVTVFDGPFTSVPDGDYLTVGWTPTGDNVTGQQAFAGLGNHARNEEIDIPCYCDSYSGSTATSVRRTASFAMFAAVENMLRVDSTLGGVIPNPGWAQISNYTAYEEQTEKGLAVGVVFHVTVQARI